MANGESVVRDITVRNVRTVSPETPAVQAAKIMVDAGIRHLIVTDTLKKVVGVLSQRVILKELSPWLCRTKHEIVGERDTPGFPVAEVMSVPPVTTPEHTPIRKVASILASRKIGCLPVVAGRNRLVGIVSVIDVLRSLAGTEHTEPEEEFQVYMPPALLKDGMLLLPMAYCRDTSFEGEVLAILAHSPQSKRIGVKFFVGAEVTDELAAARPAALVDGNVCIPAADFIEHFNLQIHGPLTVTRSHETGYLVLSPLPFCLDSSG